MNSSYPISSRNFDIPVEPFPPGADTVNNDESLSAYVHRVKFGSRPTLSRKESRKKLSRLSGYHVTNPRQRKIELDMNSTYGSGKPFEKRNNFPLKNMLQSTKIGRVSEGIDQTRTRRANQSFYNNDMQSKSRNQERALTRHLKISKIDFNNSLSQSVKYGSVMSMSTPRINETQSQTFINPETTGELPENQPQHGQHRDQTGSSLNEIEMKGKARRNSSQELAPRRQMTIYVVYNKDDPEILRRIQSFSKEQQLKHAMSVHPEIGERKPIYRFEVYRSKPTLKRILLEFVSHIELNSEEISDDEIFPSLTYTLNTLGAMAATSPFIVRMFCLPNLTRVQYFGSIPANCKVILALAQEARIQPSPPPFIKSKLDPRLNTSPGGKRQGESNKPLRYSQMDYLAVTPSQASPSHMSPVRKDAYISTSQPRLEDNIDNTYYNVGPNQKLVLKNNQIKSHHLFSKQFKLDQRYIREQKSKLVQSLYNSMNLSNASHHIQTSQLIDPNHVHNTALHSYIDNDQMKKLMTPVQDEQTSRSPRKQNLMIDNPGQVTQTGFSGSAVLQHQKPTPFLGSRQGNRPPRITTSSGASRSVEVMDYVPSSCREMHGSSTELRPRPLDLVHLDKALKKNAVDQFRSYLRISSLRSLAELFLLPGLYSITWDETQELFGEFVILCNETTRFFDFPIEFNFPNFRHQSFKNRSRWIFGNLLHIDLPTLMSAYPFLKKFPREEIGRIIDIIVLTENVGTNMSVTTSQDGLQQILLQWNQFIRFKTFFFFKEKLKKEEKATIFVKVNTFRFDLNSLPFVDHCGKRKGNPSGEIFGHYSKLHGEES